MVVWNRNIQFNPNANGQDMYETALLLTETMLAIWFYLLMNMELNVDCYNAIFGGFDPNLDICFGKSKFVTHNLKQLSF